MPRKIEAAIVGAGRLGTALALELSRAGYRVREIVVHRPASQSIRALARQIGAQLAVGQKAKLDAPLLWLCVPDREIEPLARQLSASRDWKGRVVVHSSGVLASEVLAPLRRRGAAVASLHPMMTFVRDSHSSLCGVLFGVEGDPAAVRVARKIVGDLGGAVFLLNRKKKVLYHIWGMFGSPLLLSLLVAAEEIAVKAGVPRAAARKGILPIASQTLSNYARLSAAEAFSGPIIRGDVATVKKHVDALRKFPEGKAAYIALAKAAMRFLPVTNRKELAGLLRPADPADAR